MWIFWLFVAGVLVVGGSVTLWAWRTREISPAHSNPARRRQAARHSARTAQVHAWERYARGILHRFGIWLGIQWRKAGRPVPRQLPPPALVAEAPELTHEPGDDGPEDPAWAAELRQQVETPPGPDAPIKRGWSDPPEDTGTRSAGAPPPAEHPDSFNGKPEED